MEVEKMGKNQQGTKKRILQEALSLFAEHGYGNVFVGQIADAVGIKAPSLYKHYKSKKDIFEAILEEMKQNYEKQAGILSMDGSNATADANLFGSISEDDLVKTGMGLFLYFLHDEMVCKFRKMLTIEQFHDSELSKIYSKQYVSGPLEYQAMLFQILSNNGCLSDCDSSVMALQFYAPIYLLLTNCDREPSKEPEAVELLEKHIRQFSKLYSRRCDK